MPLSTDLKIHIRPLRYQLKKWITYQVLLKNNYPDWMIKEPEKKPQPWSDPETGKEVRRSSSFLSLMFLASVKNLEEWYAIPMYK